MHDPTATTATDLAELLGRPARVPFLNEALELAELERDRWPELRRQNAGKLVNDGEDDDGDDDDGDKDGDKDGDDDGDKDGDDDGDEDEDDGDDELTKARKAATKANQELRKLKRAQADEESESKKKAGKFEELYNETKAELDELKSEREENAKRDVVEAAATAAGARNAATVFKVLKADGKLADVEDDVDAKRAIRELRKADPDLFSNKSRQRRGAGGSDNGADDDDDEDEDDDDRDRGRRTKSKKDEPRGPDRLRRHFAAEEKRRAKSGGRR